MNFMKINRLQAVSDHDCIGISPEATKRSGVWCLATKKSLNYEPPGGRGSLDWQLMKPPRLHSALPPRTALVTFICGHNYNI